MKADFLQKLSSEAKEGKIKCHSFEVICFITYQQLLQGVYCSGKSGSEANFWKDGARFDKSIEIAGLLLYMNVLWASQKWFIQEGTVLKLHMDFTYISKGMGLILWYWYLPYGMYVCVTAAVGWALELLQKKCLSSV